MACYLKQFVENRWLTSPVIENRDTFLVTNRRYHLAAIFITTFPLFLQFLTDADDVDTGMLDFLRLISSDDIGKDESNVQMLLKVHEKITKDLNDYNTTIDALQDQVLQTHHAQWQTDRSGFFTVILEHDWAQAFQSIEFLSQNI